MRFVPHGPDIPNELLESSDQGNVVFFCGAGVSYPAGMPDFLELANNVVDELGVPKDASSRQLLSQWHYQGPPEAARPPLDQIFNLLQQREYTAEEIDYQIAKCLKTKPQTRLSQHETILRLSTDTKGKPQIVTTNFDLLFERAAARKLKTRVAPILPDLAGGQPLEGLVYLHGRIKPNMKRGEGRQGLVISSSDFGRAYLAEGWATRFVRDLLDRYTVVLLGYTANDPPVTYLLQGLHTHGHESRRALYAFDDGTDRESASRWSDRGVELITYCRSANHAALWDTLNAWAERADDPPAWKQKIVQLSRRGPTRLEAYQRGQVASLVSSDDGANLFAEATPKPPGEWLCVFDPRIRYGQVDPPFGDTRPRYDPLPIYRLDNDPPRASDDGNPITNPKDMLSSRWAENPASEFARLAYWPHSPRPIPLTPPLRHLAEWVTAVIHEPVTAWWAAKYDRLHPELLTKIEQRLDQEHDELAPECFSLWTLFAERFRKGSEDELKMAWFDTSGRIKKHGWTNGGLRAFESTGAPYLEIASPHGRHESEPPSVNWADLHFGRIVRFEVAFPTTTFEPLRICDDVLPAVYQIIRRHLELAAGLLKDSKEDQRFWQTSTLYPEEDEGRAHPTPASEVVSCFRNLFDRMTGTSPDTVRADMILWPKEEPFFFDKLRLWAWAGNLLPGNEAADQLLALSDRAFWNPYHCRELLLLLKARWRDFPPVKSSELQDRLIKGRNKRDGESNEDYLRDRSVESATRLGWLMLQGCGLDDDTQDALHDLRAADPHWRQEWDADAAKSHDMKVFSVKSVDDPSAIMNAPLGQIVPLATELTRDSHHEHITYWPFDGLVRQNPRKAVAALTNAARRNNYPSQLWSAALHSWPDGQRIRLIWLFGLRLARLPSTQVFDLRRDVFRWLERHMPALTKSYQSRALEMFDALIDRLFEADPDSTTNDLMISDQRSRTTVNHAINAPVGMATALLVRILNSRRPGKNSGIPLDIKARLQHLLNTPGDSSNPAVCVVARNLQWFDYVDPRWTSDTVLPWFDSTHPSWEPAWNGFLVYCRTLPEPRLFSLLKPRFLETFPLVASCTLEDSALRKLHDTLVWACRQHREDSAYVSYGEARQALQQTDEEGRTQALSCLKQNGFIGKRVEWTRFAKPFLLKAWPKEARFRTDNSSLRLADLVVNSGNMLPDVIRTILPHLTAIAQHHSVPYELLHGMQNQDRTLETARMHPELILTFLDKLVPQNPRITPYGLAAAIEMSAGAKPELRQDKRWRRLKTLALRR